MSIFVQSKLMRALVKIFIFSGLILTACTEYPKNAVPVNELEISVQETEVSELLFTELMTNSGIRLRRDSMPVWSFDTITLEWTPKIMRFSSVQDSLIPARGVSWSEACAYCTALNGRLPAAEEWTHAANAEFIPGNIWEGFFPLKDEGLDGYLDVAPAGSFKPNSFGLFDMYGNLREWTNSKDSSGMVIVKGGSYLTDYNSGGFLPQAEHYVHPDSLLADVGFRCVFETLDIGHKTQTPTFDQTEDER